MPYIAPKTRKIKFTLREILEAHQLGELDGNETFYRKQIVPFIREQAEKDTIYAIKKGFIRIN